MQIVMSQYYHLQQLLESSEDISANGAIRGPSYHYKHNPVTSNVTNKYNEDQLDPLPSNFNVSLNTYTNPNSGLANRPNLAPYYLFFGKFASQSVSNLQPKFTRHLDEIGQTQNQQPSNIYNIPDYPKDYTLYEANIPNNNPIRCKRKTTYANKLSNSK